MERIELTGEWALGVQICANAETLGVHHEEDVQEIVKAGQDRCFDVLDNFAEENRKFADWHGGPCVENTLAGRAHFVAVDAYSRRLEMAKDGTPANLEESAFGELAWGDWTWSSKIPVWIRLLCEVVANEISEAMTRAAEEIQKGN